MPPRAIFLLLLRFIDLLQWVKNNTNRCHRSLAGVEFHLPFSVPQQQQCCCNGEKGFSLALRSYIHTACPICLYQQGSLNSWCGWAWKDGDSCWNNSLHNNEWRSLCCLCGNPQMVWKWLAESCQHATSAVSHSSSRCMGIFSSVIPVLKHRSGPEWACWEQTEGETRSSSMHICLLSLAAEAASKDVGCDSGF